MIDTPGLAKVLINIAVCYYNILKSIVINQG